MKKAMEKFEFCIHIHAAVGFRSSDVNDVNSTGKLIVQSTLNRVSASSNASVWGKHPNMDIWKNGHLKWRVDIGDWNKRKASSPMLKVYVIALPVDDTQTAESIVGWFLLDLRTANIPKTWIPLHQSVDDGKVQVSTWFEVAGEETSGNVEVQDEQIEEEKLDLHVEKLSGSLVFENSSASLSEDFLKIGESGDTIFVVAISIGGCEDLAKFVHNRLSNAQDYYDAGFWFSYTFLDVVVQTDIFHDPAMPDYAPIRDHFRVKSCANDLKEFFQNTRSLHVFLCTSHRIIGSIDIPLQHWIDDDAMDDTFTMTEIAAKFPFVEDETQRKYLLAQLVLQKQHVPITATDTLNIVLPDKPAVERQLQFVVKHVLLYEEMLQDPVFGDHILQLKVLDDTIQDTAQMTSVEAGTIELIANKLFKVVPEGKLQYDLECREMYANTIIGFGTIVLNAKTDQLMEVHFDIRNTDSIVIGKAMARIGKNVDSIPSDAYIQIDESSPRLLESFNSVQSLHTEPVFETPKSNPNDIFKFRCSIDLRSVKLLKDDCKLYMTYKHPTFGKHGIAQTRPINAVKNTEILVPKSFCMYEFCMTEKMLSAVFAAGLVVDLRQIVGDKDTHLATLEIPISRMLHREKYFQCGYPGCKTTLTNLHALEQHKQKHSGEVLHIVHQSFDDYVVANSVLQSANHPIAKVRVIVSLETLEKTDKISSPIDNVLIEGDSVESSPKPEPVAKRSPSTSPLKFSGRQETPFSPPSDVATGSLPAQRENNETRAEKSIPTQPNPNVVKLDRDILEPTVDVDAIRTNAYNQACAEIETSWKLKFEELRFVVAQEKNEWDLEKESEAKEFRAALQSVEENRMNELEKEWLIREEERSELVKQTLLEYQKLEAKLRHSLAQVELRERKLAVVEEESKRNIAAKMEDIQVLHRRIRSESSHTVTMAEKKVEAVEARLKLMEEQVRRAETRYTRIEEEYAAYRTEQRKTPEAALKDEIGKKKGIIIEMEKRLEEEKRDNGNLLEEKQRLTSQLEKLARVVVQERKKNENKLYQDLENLRLKYLAREEKYMLDGDREELHSIKRDLANLQSETYVLTKKDVIQSIQAEHPVSKPGSSDFINRSPMTERDVNNATLLANDEVQRLRKEREDLLESSSYTPNSYLIQELDRQIYLAEATRSQLT